MRIPTRLYLMVLTTSVSFCAHIFAAKDPNSFDPDNAAYWYAQAVERYKARPGIEEFNKDAALHTYSRGETELTPAIEQRIKESRPIIALITRGTECDHCDFQFDPLANGTYNANPYSLNAMALSWKLLAAIRYDAEHTSDFDYFSRIETVLRWASDLDPREICDFYSICSIRESVYVNLQNYLNQHADLSIQSLERIKSILDSETARSKDSHYHWATEQLAAATKMLTDYKTFDTGQLLWHIPAEKLTADFFARNLAYFDSTMKWYQRHLALPYSQAHKEIKALRENLLNEAAAFYGECEKRLDKSENDYQVRAMAAVFKKKSTTQQLQLLANMPVEYLENCSFLYTIIMSPDLSLLAADVKSQTCRNAILNAVSLMISYRTNQILPDRLPPDSPKDLFSNKPFRLIQTDQGFKLRCQARDLFSHKVYEYEFTLPKK